MTDRMAIPLCVGPSKLLRCANYSAPLCPCAVLLSLVTGQLCTYNNYFRAHNPVRANDT